MGFLIKNKLYNFRIGRNKDIEKYGLENFEFEIVDTASSNEELDIKHKEYIKKYNSLETNGYNKLHD